jgi:hypothetical protein
VEEEEEGDETRFKSTGGFLRPTLHQYLPHHSFEARRPNSLSP